MLTKQQKQQQEQRQQGHTYGTQNGDEPLQPRINSHDKESHVGAETQRHAEDDNDEQLGSTSRNKCSASTSSSDSGSDKRQQNSRERIGRAAWHAMHSFLANVELHGFNNVTWSDVRDYIHLTARLFPCKSCSQGFQKYLKIYPVPQLDGTAETARDTLSSWLCMMHNGVNKKLQKNLKFDCSWSNLQRVYQMQSTS